MSACICIVQEGEITPAQRATLQTKLEGFTEQHFGTAAGVQWLEVAKGSGYTAGKPSTTSFVSVTANEPLDRSSRAKLLRQLCETWSAEARCSLDEVLAVLMDPALP